MSQVSGHYHFQMKGSLNYTFPEMTLTFLLPDMRECIVVGMELFFFFFLFLIHDCLLGVGSLVHDWVIMRGCHSKLFLVQGDFRRRICVIET